MNDETQLIHQTQLPVWLSKGTTIPLETSTVFAMTTPSSMEGFQYGRVGNPTRQALEDNLALYAHAKHCITTASGSAALTAILHLLETGDQVICHDEVYEGTQRILVNHFQKLGIEARFLDCSNESLLRQTLKQHKKIKLVLIESPTNPLLQVLDIREICAIAHTKKVQVIVDNTFATSMVQEPLSLGADISVESLSKGINGHSNVIGGMIATNDDLIFHEVQRTIHTLGIGLSPRDAHQVLTGLQTLALRVEKQCTNALKIVEFLSAHPNVERVMFPELKSIPDGQMKKSGSLISFNIKRNPSGFLSKLKLITIGHSFGGLETLIQQPTIMMDLSWTKNELEDFGIDDSFFRLSVGCEHHDDIIEDLKNALEEHKGKGEI